MARNDQDRLKKLVELRDTGVLSDEEYQSARARLIAAARRQREPEATPEEVEKASIFSAYWPAFVGVGVLLLLIVAVVVYGSIVSDDDVPAANLVVQEDFAANVLDVAPNNAELCAATDIYARIKDMIFERAQQEHGGNPAPLDSLRRSVGVRMQYPLLRAVHPDVGRTDCGGRLILDLPPTVRGAFEGAPALEADLEYAVQPAADGNGNVVQFTGADEIIRQLAVAAGVAAARAPSVEAGSASGRTYNPSFDCAEAGSAVERIICGDEELSRLDRGLASHYRALRDRVVPEDWQLISDAQRAFLRRRAACADSNCVRDAYVAQVRFLDRFGSEDDL